MLRGGVVTVGASLTAADVVGLTVPLLAAAQAVLASWRDLGAAPVAAAGVAVALAGGAPSPIALGAIALGAVISAVGWARGASHGVARPGVDGAVLAAVIVGVVMRPVLTAVIDPGLSAAPLDGFVAGALALAGAAGSLVAMERPGPRRRRLPPPRRVVEVER